MSGCEACAHDLHDPATCDDGETEGDVILFSVPLPPTSLRANSRSFWARKKKDADAYGLAVLEAIAAATPLYVHASHPAAIGGKAWPSADVTYTWYYAGAEPDHSNLGGHTKYLQDILCTAPKLGIEQAMKYKRWHLGLIENDKGITATYKAVKVAHRKDERVEVTVTKRDTILAALEANP